MYVMRKAIAPLFGLYVGVDKSCEIDAVVTTEFSVYVGHSWPIYAYSVVLPSSAFSESSCLFLNLLGIVQRTVKAVQLQVTEYDIPQTTDVVLFSLLRYILRTVHINTRCSTNYNVCNNAFVVHSFKAYFPYAVNYVSDSFVSIELQNSGSCLAHSIIYVSRIRSNYATDIISRNAII